MFKKYIIPAVLFLALLTTGARYGVNFVKVLDSSSVAINPATYDAQTDGTQSSQFVDESGTPYGVKHITNKPRVVANFYLDEIGLGNVPGHTAVYKFGNNNAVGTTQETIWGEGGLYPWAAIDAAAGVVTISSTSTQDTLTTGTGAWTATIYGLDLSGADQSETLNLNGQNAVSSVSSYSRVFRIICMSAGSGLANAGIIRVGTGTVTAGVPAVVWAHVAIGDNQTLQCIYTVPTGKTLAIKAAEYSVNGTKGAEGRIYARPSGQLFQIKDVFHLEGGSEPHEYILARTFAAGTDLDFRSTAGGSNYDISANFQGWYE